MVYRGNNFSVFGRLSRFHLTAKGKPSGMAVFCLGVYPVLIASVVESYRPNGVEAQKTTPEAQVFPLQAAIRTYHLRSAFAARIYQYLSIFLKGIDEKSCLKTEMIFCFFFIDLSRRTGGGKRKETYINVDIARSGWICVVDQVI